MELVTAVVPLVLEYSIAPIARHVSYPFNYKRKVTSLEEGLNKLKIARDGRKLWVDEHERNGKEISQDVLDWLKNVDEFIEKEEAELGLANEETKKKCCLGFCPNLKTRYRVSKKAEQKAEVAAGFSQKNGTFSTDHHVHTPPLQCTGGFSSKDFEAFESRMSILDDIMKALRSVDVNTIGVYGTGGVGKTTLAREVGRKAREEKLFDEVIMVPVTTEVDVINIQNTIADFLGLKFNEESKEGRAARLCERLMKKEKKTLVILDDLWKKLKLEEVGIPQPGEHNGCKLLLTSRNSNVLSNEMGSQHVFPINALAEDEAWSLFQKMSNSSFDDPVAMEVAKWCGGLPIAIVTVASSLKGKDNYEWRNALTTLKTTPPEDLPEILAEVYWPIQLSYSKLETEELRSTFLLCCQLGYNSTIRDLLKYCIGLDLLDVDKVEDAQCRVYSLVRELKRRCLLLEGPSNGQLVMHDLVRDVGRWIAYHHYGAVVVAADRNHRKDWADEEKIKTYKRIWLYNNAVKLQEELSCPDLVFLHIDGDLQLPDKLFKGLDKLKVLSLTGFNFSSLPSSVGLLKSLKMLSFYRSSQLGDDVRVVGELKKLEVLIFAKSNIRHLPKEMGQLTNLKLLDLSDCYTLQVIPSNVLSKLTRLEELYMANSFDGWEPEGGGYASLTELTQLHSLSNLEIVIGDANLIPEGLFSERLYRYRIFIGEDSYSWRNEDMVKTLRMKLGADNNMPNGVLELLKDTQELYLNGVENILCLAGMQSFSKLRYVKVKSCNKLTHLFSFTVAQGLSQLQLIKVRDCESMEEIVSEENKLANTGKREATTMEEIVFPQLLRLELGDLPRLKRFCKGYLLKCPLLKGLEIERCPDLKTFISREHENMRLAGTPPPALFHDWVTFPSLVEMEIDGLDSIESIWDNQLASGSFGELRILSINECQKLRKVFPSAQHGRFQKLEELRVWESELVEEIFEDEEGGSINHAISFQLRVLHLSELPKLKNVFPYSIATHLQTLERILILKSGVEEIVAAAKAEMNGETSVCFEFPELTSLELVRVPTLRGWYPGMHTLRLPKLKHLEITIDIQMPLLFPREVICNLQELELYGGRNSESKPWHEDFPANLFSTLKLLELSGFGNLEGIPVSILQEFHNLEKLSVEGCAFEELFSFDGSVTAEVVERLLPRLKHLQLRSLKDLRYLCGGQQNHTFDLSPLFRSLETLKVEGCHSLVSVVRPSSTTVSFQNLTSLSFWTCNKLENIVTTTTAESLSNLVTLEVRYCDRVTEIVEKSEGGDDGDDEITFTKLQNLDLYDLRSLTSFCSGNYGFSFPCLNEVSVVRCPKMKLFSHHGQLLYTPKLSNVRFKESWEEYKERWEGNLNATIRQLHIEMVRSLKLSEFPELREIWHGQLPVESFCQLEELEVDGCSNFSTALPLNLMPYLKELWKLNVRECDSLEGVFDWEKLLLNPDALHDALLPRLLDLWLSDLPRLHHIFPSHPPPIFDFKRLRSLELRNCSSLKNVLTTSMALCLVSLKSIEIINCIALEEIITQQDNAGESSVAKVIFPQLRTVVLESLPNLISFNSGSGILKFSSLVQITVDKCPKMKPFISSFLRGQLSKVVVDEIQPVATTSLIDDYKVAYPSLTKLRMDWNDAMEEIGRGEFQANFFSQLHTLAIINLPHHHLTFPSHFLQRFHNVKNLTLENAMFEEITIHEGTNGEDTSGKLRNLTLSNLPRLMHLSVEGSPLSSIFLNLESLKVFECGRLEILVPSTISFQSLTTLQVSKCHKLLYLMTCTAAKSLALLTRMIVTECQMLEQIVGNDENVAESEVTLTKLECLELHCLPSLLGFSLSNCAFTFPSLKDVIVRECPKMKIFSQGVVTAPKLRRVIQTEGKEKWCWKGSLNATIQKLYQDQAKSNLDVDGAGQLVRNGKSHMFDGTSSGDFCEIKNPSVTKDQSPDTTTKHNEDHEDRCSPTPMDIRSISQAQMDDFSTDQNKTIPPSSSEQSVYGDATATPSSHNQQGVSSVDHESLHKSDPAPRPREEEQVSKQDEKLRKQEEQLRTQEEQLRKQEEQLRAQEERLRAQEVQLRTQEEQLRKQEEQTDQTY